MEKRDIIIIVVAIIIVLLMAMYVKPLVTGQPVKLLPDEIAAFFGGGNQTGMTNNTSFLNETLNGTNTSQFEMPNLSSNTTINASANLSLPTPSPTPSPIPTWSGTSVDTGLKSGNSNTYIYPRNYPVDSNPIYSFNQESSTKITYTKFSGKNSAKTNVFYIPTGYWELWYSVEVNQDVNNPTVSSSSGRVKNSDGTYSYNKRMDSISVISPQFSIKVQNADTGSDVRSITPTGGLNPRLWKGTFASPNVQVFDSDFKPPSPETVPANYKWDPRPWKEKFYEGYQNYTLDINAQNLISYNIEIKVPDPNSPANNITPPQSKSSNQASPGDLMEKTLNTYLASVNGNISDPVIFENITSSLSQNTLSQYSRDDIFREMNQIKNAGITITGFTKTSDFFQGPAGSLKGNLAYSTKTGVRVIPMDIPFVQEFTGWKINDLPLIRT